METKQCEYNKCINTWNKDDYQKTKKYCSRNCSSKHRAIVNPESARKAYKTYYNKNKAKRFELHKKRLERPLYKLAYLIRICTSKHLTIGMNTGKYRNMIGCTQQEFKQHLEKQFTKDMNWENYGTYWNLDHIQTLSSAKTKEDMIKLAHYTNIQPLTIVDNSVKNNK